MSRYDEQPSIGFGAARLFAGFFILLFGGWVGETVGRSFGSQMTAALVGFAMAPAVKYALGYGEPFEEEGARVDLKSKLWMLLKIGLVVAWICVFAVQAVRRIKDGVSYQDSVGLGFLFGLVITAAFAHWRQNVSPKRQHSS